MLTAASPRRMSAQSTSWPSILDSGGYETRGHAITSAAHGYAFHTDDIPPGRYAVVAGTDRDGDATICDAGEACGIPPCWRSMATGRSISASASTCSHASRRARWQHPRRGIRGWRSALGRRVLLPRQRASSWGTSAGAGSRLAACGARGTDRRSWLRSRCRADGQRA